MPFAFRCPKCETSLRRGRAPDPGEEIECPKCGTEFAPVAAEEADEDEPRARRAPSGRDRDDDRPRPARRRDDDAADRRPRRSRERERQSSNSVPLILAAVGGVGLLGLVAAGAAVWALSGRKPDPAPVAQAPQPAPEARPAPGGPNPPPGPNGPAAEAVSDQELLETTRKATVRIRVEAGPKLSSGSGFLVRTSPDAAYVVTNFHVIDTSDDEPAPKQDVGPPRPGFPPGFGPPGFPPRPPIGRPPGFGPPGFGPPGFGGKQPAKPDRPKARVSVIFHSGTAGEQAHPAEVVALDPEADLATLRVAGARNVPDPIDLAREAPVHETMPVYIYGFPGGDPTLSVGEGKVSQLRQDAGGALEDVQINGQINPGNSGGPVVDGRGRLVGIAVSTVRGKNVGFAIPAGRLDHMLKGSVLAGLVFRVQPTGATGEFWFLDRKRAVLGRDVFQGQLAGAPATGPGEFRVLAALNDPMHKLNAVTAHFARDPGAAAKPTPDGWAPLANAEAIQLRVRDDEAVGTFRLPAGAYADDTFAFQFSYTAADGRTVYTQPHPLRLTFPKNPKSLTLHVSTPTDEPTRRYLDDQITKTFAGPAVRTFRTPQGVTVEIDPVDDPKAAVAKIAFGEVVAVEGRTVTVKVGPVDLPLPTEQELTLALNDLKSTDGNRRRAGADRLAKVYAIVPGRREEVAKALEAVALEKDFFVRMAALGGLGMWSGPENVPALIKVLETGEGQARVAASNLLAKYKDASAAPALAKCLPGGFERGAASAALKAIGPAAEKAVIPYLTNKDPWTAREACGIIQEIGGEASVGPLQEVLKGNPNFMVGPAATNALKAVQERAKRQPKE